MAQLFLQIQTRGIHIPEDVMAMYQSLGFQMRQLQELILKGACTKLDLSLKFGIMLSDMIEALHSETLALKNAVCMCYLEYRDEIC